MQVEGDLNRCFNLDNIRLLRDSILRDSEVDTNKGPALKVKLFIVPDMERERFASRLHRF